MTADHLAGVVVAAVNPQLVAVAITVVPCASVGRASRAAVEVALGTAADLEGGLFREGGGGGHAAGSNEGEEGGELHVGWSRVN